MTLTVAPHRLQQPVAETAFNNWSLPGGTLWTQFFRTSSGYLIRFPELADFEINADGQLATAHPVAGVAASTIEHLYLNQVLPLMLSKQGQLMFHASAVVLEHGAVVFAAESGRGKSTLAASFAVTGNALLTDDGLILESVPYGYNVLPSHPSIRLWADSTDALITPGTPTSPAISYSSKSRFLAGEHVQFCKHPCPLQCVFFLGKGKVSEVTIQPVSPATALVEWVRHSFLLDIEEQPSLASHFDIVASLSKHPFHFFLDYPRDYSYLPQVQAAIIDHLHTITSS